MEEAKLEISLLKLVKYFIVFLASSIGITMNVNIENALIALVGACLLAGWNYLKHKYPGIQEYFKFFQTE